MSRDVNRVVILFPPLGRGVTFGIICLCVFVWILANKLHFFMDLFALTPVKAFKGYVWQFMSYMFLHKDFFHMFLNMFLLYMFGPSVEGFLGSKRYLVHYLLCGLGAAFLHMVVMAPLGGLQVSMLGASGAVMGVLAAYGVLFPNNVVYFMFVLPMRAKTLVVLLLFLEVFYGFVYLESFVAHWGHVGGLIVGVILGYVYRGGAGAPGWGRVPRVSLGRRSVEKRKEMVMSGRCAVCGELVFLPFRCGRCNRFFCAEHRLPEAHDCLWV